jgi:hypothetical protein
LKGRTSGNAKMALIIHLFGEVPFCLTLNLFPQYLLTEKILSNALIILTLFTYYYKKILNKAKAE